MCCELCIFECGRTVCKLALIRQAKPPCPCLQDLQRRMFSHTGTTYVHERLGGFSFLGSVTWCEVIAASAVLVLRPSELLVGFS